MKVGANRGHVSAVIGASGGKFRLSLTSRCGISTEKIAGSTASPTVPLLWARGRPTVKLASRRKKDTDIDVVLVVRIRYWFDRYDDATEVIKNARKRTGPRRSVVCFQKLMLPAG